jgi:tetratricopeptide (TPR) repeat protein
MRHALAAAFATVCFALGMAGCDGTAFKQGGSVSAQMTELETQALDEYRNGRLLTARRLAEEALAANSASLVGHYVLGCALREAEGAPASAMAHLGRARELYETTWSVAPPSEGAPWELHREILFAIQEVAQELEIDGYRLSIIEYYDALYEPDLHAQRAWTLMRLGDIEGARAATEAGTNTVDPSSRSLALNARCAIETVVGTRATRLEACAAAFDNAARRAQADTATDPMHSTNVAVHAYNAALAAMATGDAERAAEFVVAGTRRLAFTAANPWRLLVSIQLASGQMNDALTSLRRMDDWRSRQPPYLRDQVRADTEATFATAMLAAGENEAGLAAIDRALAQPDRRGLVTSDADSALGGHALLRRALRLLDNTARAEQIACGDDDARLPWRARIDRAWATSADAQRIRGVLANRERIEGTFDVYSSRGLTDLPTWLMGDLIDVIGPGAFESAVDDARRDTDNEAFAAVYEALLAEASYRRGRNERALEHADRALGALTEAESMLRARTALVAAAASADLGRRDDSLAWLVRAWQIAPSMVRILDVPIPAVVRSAGSALDDEVAERIRGSARFDRRENALVVDVSGDLTTVRSCLLLPDGTTLACAETTREEGESDADYTARACVDAHARLFGPPIRVSTVDLGSLDGTTSVNQEAARRSVEEALQRIIEAR